MNSVDSKPDTSGSFEHNASFQHTSAATTEKLNKVFRLSEQVNAEIEHMFNDSKNLPASLRI